MEEKKMNSQQIEGRNAVMEAFRSGKPIDKVYILDGCQDGPIRSIVREAKKHDTILNFVTKERLNQISETGRHQGVIAQAAAYEYAQVEDMLELAKQKGEDPFLILLDNIEDPHNLGAIIRTANLAGAHGVIIPKHRAAGLTATVAKTSAGALNYTPVAKVTNLVKTMEELKEKGLWFVCADMNGDVMYRVNLKGPIGLVIGNEGEGVGRLVKETCDMTAAIPMKGDIDSLNASVAAGVLAYEIVRQRMSKRVVDQLMDGTYSHGDHEIFRDLYNSLLNTQGGDRPDRYFILKDFRSYAEAQKKVEEAYKDPDRWAKMALLNTASCGKFTSDRTIQEYVDNIWKLDYVTVKPEA